MAWSVYVIRSEVDGRLYKGMSENIHARLAVHNGGKVSSTKAYRPWILVHEESCRDSTHAREREKFLKSSAGRAFLKSIGSNNG
jgi:putative endonuclease